MICIAYKVHNPRIQYQDVSLYKQCWLQYQHGLYDMQYWLVCSSMGMYGWGQIVVVLVTAGGTGWFHTNNMVAEGVHE